MRAPQTFDARGQSNETGDSGGKLTCKMLYPKYAFSQTWGRVDSAPCLSQRREKGEGTETTSTRNSCANLPIDWEGKVPPLRLHANNQSSENTRKNTNDGVTNKPSIKQPTPSKWDTNSRLHPNVKQLFLFQRNGRSHSRCACHAHNQP